MSETEKTFEDVIEAQKAVIKTQAELVNALKDSNELKERMIKLQKQMLSNYDEQVKILQFKLDGIR